MSSGTAGTSSVNLRNLGTNRTLVLIDGQRSVPSTVQGLVDINTIPQQLIERVEVVTGGASAAYGSDAVGGVVNFILDRKFTGFKADVSGGLTDYGDNQNGKISLTGGAPFADRSRARAPQRPVLFAGWCARRRPAVEISQGWQIVNNPAYKVTNGVLERSACAPAARSHRCRQCDAGRHPAERVPHERHAEGGGADQHARRHGVR